MKRKTIRQLVPTALGLALLAAGPALAATGTADVSVNIVNPLGVAWVADMAFGDIAPPSGGSGSTVFTLDGGGVVTASGGDGHAFTSTTSAAEFSVSGYGDSLISVTASAADPTLGTGGGLSFIPQIIGAPTALSGGSATVTVGGELTVSSGVLPGSYSTDVLVTVLYQ